MPTIKGYYNMEAMMKRLVLGIVLLFAAGNLFGQNLSDNFISDFRSADGELKLQVLEMSREQPVAELEDLYLHVLDYVISNAEDGITDDYLRSLYNLAAERLVEAQSTKAGMRVWQLFELDRETAQRISLLKAMETLATGNERVLIRLADWIVSENQASLSGTTVDRQVLSQAVSTAVTFNSVEFFDGFILTLYAGHPDYIENFAKQGIAAYGDQRMELFVQAAEGFDPDAQIFLMRFIQQQEDLTAEQKAAVAAAALEKLMSTTVVTIEDQELHRAARRLAAGIISEVRYPDASGPMALHFNQVANDYEKRMIPLGQMIEAIDALGSIGNEAAASRLIRYLEYLNIQSGNERPVNPQIMLAVVNSLGEIGSSEAYNALFYATMLDYPGFVQEAIQQAIESLQR